jgi:hypothetical protein
MLLIGVAGFIASRFIPAYYKTAVAAAAAFFFVVGVFMAGAIHDNEAWEARVREMEAKIAEVKVESEKENTKIETKYVNKVQVIKERGKDTIQYIDREVVKYDNLCVIPKEFIIAHNKAAEQLK